MGLTSGDDGVLGAVGGAGISGVGLGEAPGAGTLLDGVVVKSQGRGTIAAGMILIIETRFRLLFRRATPDAYHVAAHTTPCP